MALTTISPALQDTQAQYTGFKNRIINGAMMIDQRNAGASVTPTDASFTLDRWKAYASQTSKFTVQQNAGSVTPPEGFVNYLGVTSSSAYSVGASERFGIVQQIEGLNVADLAWGTVSASAVTLSFKVYSSLTGTFGGALVNSAYTRSYPFSYTISSPNSWTTVSVTIAGDTTGTWLTTNGVGIAVWFSLGAGSSVVGTAGAWAAGGYLGASGQVNVVGTNGATFYITGVQLEKGSTATSFDYRPYGTELALCQRYFYYVASETTGGYIIISAQWVSSTVAQAQQLHPVPMRAIPSFLIVGAPQAVAANGSRTGTYSSIANDGTNSKAIAVSVTYTGSTGVAGNATAILGSGTSTTDGIRVSAEL